MFLNSVHVNTFQSGSGFLSTVWRFIIWRGRVWSFAHFYFSHCTQCDSERAHMFPWMQLNLIISLRNISRTGIAGVVGYEFHSFAGNWPVILPGWGGWGGGGDFSLQILTGVFSSLYTCHEACTGKTLKVTGVLCAHHRAAFVVWVRYVI